MKTCSAPTQRLIPPVKSYYNAVAITFIAAFNKELDMAFTGTKSIFSSVTLIGILVAMFTRILALFGLDLGADSAGLLSNVVDAGLTFFGALMVIYGRIRATKNLSLSRSGP